MKITQAKQNNSVGNNIFVLFVTASTRFRKVFFYVKSLYPCDAGLYYM